jgi:hypothetical protein
MQKTEFQHAVDQVRHVEDQFFRGYALVEFLDYSFARLPETGGDGRGLQRLRRFRLPQK